MKIKKPIEELDNKVKELKEAFGEQTYIECSLDNLKNFFKKSYNKDLFKKGDICWLNLKTLCNTNPEYKKIFGTNYIQPIKITYKRCDLIFYKYINYPDIEERYFSDESHWAKWLYPSKLSKYQAQKLKIKKLINKDPDELYVQLNLINFDNFNGLIIIEDDVEEVLKTII